MALPRMQSMAANKNVSPLQRRYTVRMAVLYNNTGKLTCLFSMMVIKTLSVRVKKIKKL